MPVEAVRKVAITGPESSGKSALAAWLAGQWRTAWVPEFARAYLTALPNPAAYSPADLEAIARGQRAAEESAAAALTPGALLFCDTDLLVVLIWAEERFGGCPACLRTAALDPVAYHQRLLLRPDLPWEPDPLRETPDPRERARLFERYRATLRAAGLPFTEISGVGPERYAAAKRAVEAAL